MRFRTLLIATTLVAVVLGLIVWARRPSGGLFHGGKVGGCQIPHNAPSQATASTESMIIDRGGKQLRLLLLRGVPFGQFPNRASLGRPWEEIIPHHPH